MLRQLSLFLQVFLVLVLQQGNDYDSNSISRLALPIVMDFAGVVPCSMALQPDRVY